MKYHRNTFQQWGFQRIIIDEYHNVISEIFRFDSSWDAKSPEQAPQNPLVGTEFLRTVDTKPTTEPPFTPPNLLSLFLHLQLLGLFLCYN